MPVTVTVRVHVNGNYQLDASLNGETPVTIGPNEEKYIYVPHGQDNTIALSAERYLGETPTPPAPPKEPEAA